eukprot:TRINITY_DN37236_c0_g1_i1.p1 TRINITY_DN37236_c0_g1~~TRINITY_DN37236_c0_g1_i1.p1  ORF type:complete len:801 (+),score=186.47 TRINITY_DN37236_c0_g1_i1:74-2476(+)
MLLPSHISSPGRANCTEAESGGRLLQRGLGPEMETLEALLDQQTQKIVDSLDNCFQQHELRMRTWFREHRTLGVRSSKRRRSSLSETVPLDAFDAGGGAPKSRRGSTLRTLSEHASVRRSSKAEMEETLASLSVSRKSSFSGVLDEASISRVSVDSLMMPHERMYMEELLEKELEEERRGESQRLSERGSLRRKSQEKAEAKPVVAPELWAQARSGNGAARTTTSSTATMDSVVAVPKPPTGDLVEEITTLEPPSFHEQEDDEDLEKSLQCPDALDKMESEGGRRHRVTWSMESEGSSGSGSSSSLSSGCSDDEMPVLVNRGKVRARRFSNWEAQMKQKVMTMCIDDDTELLEEEDEAEPGLLSRAVHSNWFDYGFALLLACNAIVIGMQVDFAVKHPFGETADYFEILNVIFCVVFFFELVLRIYVHTPKKFFFENDCFWAWLDTVVVTAQVIEFFISVSTWGGGDSTLQSLTVLGRVVRVARVIRIVRVVRVMRFFRSFRVLITMIIGTLKNGAFALLLLVLIMYVFAIMFAQAGADAISSGHITDQFTLDELNFYYGSLIQSMVTLFKAIIGGVDWQQVMMPLSPISWIMDVLFLLYIAFVQLVVMNVVTGFFLQSALEQAQADQEHVIQMRLREKETFVYRLRNLFEELDSSADGTISLKEFTDHLQSEHMRALLQTFDIDNADAWTLFKLLDTDGGGSVDIHEFVDGCIRLKGQAKSIQMAQVMYHHKWIMDKLVELSEMLHQHITNVEADPGTKAERRASRRTSALDGGGHRRGSSRGKRGSGSSAIPEDDEHS